MNNLKQKPRGRSNTSWLIHPVNDTLAASYAPNMNRDDREASFGSSQNFPYNDDEPVPRMFRTNREASVTRPRASRANLLARGAEEPSKSHALHVTRRLSLQITLALCLAFIAGAAVHSTAATPTVGREALSSPSVDRPTAAHPLTANRGTIKSAALVSFPSATGQAGAKIYPTTSWEGSLVDRDWSETVETFKQLVVEQKATQALQMKQAENARFLGQLEAWMNAKTR